MSRVKNFLVSSLCVVIAFLPGEIKTKYSLPNFSTSSAQRIRNDWPMSWNNDWPMSWNNDWPMGWQNDWPMSWNNDWSMRWKQDYMLNDAINIILRHAPVRNRRIINEYINELLSGRYNDLNPKKILHRISNVVKNGNIKTLCDNNKSFIVIGLPHIIFNSDIFNDLKLETINVLIKNITQNLDGCQMKIHGNDISFITNGCQSQSDKDIIYDKNKPITFYNNVRLSPSNKFFSILLQCSVSSLGSGEKTMICVKEELAKDNLQMSDTCSECFKQSVDCGTHGEEAATKQRGSSDKAARKQRQNSEEAATKQRQNSEEAARKQRGSTEQAAKCTIRRCTFDGARVHP
ncbi:hypothetical protein, conserved [Plasmodium ovale wallikeri]|uniref:ZP domain-containing protein n=1 Tax=Plasmodium ovale wallikeri TaxID=864142 RepID=A0A1A8ZDP4_PLAOA|nr:hypothetical protein, conserved [Plasmodium ovale wallikeri]